MPDVPTAKKGRYHLNSTFSELTGSFIGRIFIKKIHQRFEALYADDPCAKYVQCAQKNEDYL